MTCRPRLLCALVCFACAVLAVSPALANPGNRPDPSPTSIFGLQRSALTEHLSLFTNADISLMSLTGPDRSFLDQVLVLDLALSLGLFDLMDLSASVPLFFFNDAGAGTGGDLRIQLKGQILSPQTSPIGIALSLPAFIPLTSDQAFVTSPHFHVRPLLVFELPEGLLYDRLLVSLNTGLNIESKDGGDANQDTVDRLILGLGSVYTLASGQWMLWSEVGTERFFQDYFSLQDLSRFLLTMGAKYRPDPTNSLTFTFGTSFTWVDDPLPSLAFSSGVDYGVYELDSDSDGITNTRDACPFQPEDLNSYQDQDGCPDDTDLDQIPGDLDACPTDPEDFDGFQDQDGCSEPDNDQDTIPDTTDQCRDQKEDFDQFQDDDGCPDDDNDQDGIPDAADACPDQAETINNYKDQDGCPELDTDADGTFDDADACPNLEGPPERGGCPNLDIDADGIPNTSDNCPDVSNPDQTNSDADPHGDACDPDDDDDSVLDPDDACPLEPGLPLWNGCAGKVVEVLFDSGLAVIKPESNPALEQMAQDLRKSGIQRVEIQGHTDDVGNPKDNLKLSQARAEAVRAAMIALGLPPEMLEAKGYGPDLPKVPVTKKMPKADKDAARSQNRRVEFRILSQ